ncbi:MAG: hypothetical protein H7836_13000 [Magnetococcus sp. YQC-3]
MDAYRRRDLPGKLWLAMADPCFRMTDLSTVERFAWAREQGCLSLEGGSYCIEQSELYDNAAQETGMWVHGLNISRPEGEYFALALAAARRLGALYITEIVPKMPELSQVVHYICSRRERCAAEGVLYLVETHRWSVTERLEWVRQLLERLPEQEFVGDFSHYIPLLYEEADFSFLYPRCRAVHLRVAVPNNVQVEIGPEMNHEGCQLFRGIWLNLLASGFAGPVVAEIIPHYVTYPRYDSVQDNTYALQFFRQLIQEAGRECVGRC